jgi:hypothetical protein
MAHCSHVLSAVESWIKHGRPGGTALEDFSGPEPKLLKNEDLFPIWTGCADAVES